MVVWVFAGGGDSEVEGLIPFLERNYREVIFHRKSPVRRKPGPRPSTQPAYGMTGRSLANQIGKLLSQALRGHEGCDLILVIDDLDCHDEDERRKLFDETIGRVEGAAGLQSLVAFASPEIEAWIIADWNNTVAKDADFRSCHRRMQHWLSTQRSVSFDEPESFSRLDPVRGSCRDKLSEATVEASIECCESVRYSKATHTARFLQQLAPEVVSRKCSQFRQLHARLSQPQ